MLELHFLNVGDGDAILVEDRDHDLRLLVDCGKKDVDPAPGSMYQTAAEHLRERGIGHIHALVVTHLHEDHFGGLATLIEEVQVDRVYSGFFPDDPAMRAPEDPGDEKTVRGLTQCLNRWAETVEKLKGRGCRLCPVEDTAEGLCLTDGLDMDLICPNAGVNRAQRLVWNAMLRGEPLPAGIKYWASKSRNPNSLRLRLTYAGRAVELGGDCYGENWKGRPVSPCDVLKVPHHGDAKALTPGLVRELKPSWAVISCGSEYDPKKDRPSQWTLDLLRAQGTQVYFTDSYQGSPCWKSVDIKIKNNGEIIAPESRAGGGR